MTVGTGNLKSYDCETNYLLDIPNHPDMEDRGGVWSNLSQRDENQDSSRVDPTESKKIYFVRHGEPHVIGWDQSSLNDAGRKDAQKAAESVGDLPIEHIISSTLPRAAETARIIANRNSLPVEYDPGLRTWNLGYLNGPVDKDKEKEINRLCTSAHDEVPEGGESFNQFSHRILSTISDIVRRHNDKEIMIVSHSSPGKVLDAWTEAGQPQKQGLRLDYSKQADIEDRRKEDFHAVEAQEAREAAATRQFRKLRYPGLHNPNLFMEQSYYDFPSEIEMELHPRKRPIPLEGEINAQ